MIMIIIIIKAPTLVGGLGSVPSFDARVAGLECLGLGTSSQRVPTPNPKPSTQVQVLQYRETP